MRSYVLPSFWEAYKKLSQENRVQARRAYRLWEGNPFHPSLRFKCVNPVDHIWSLRISRGYRALGIRDGEIVTWFWIGNHDDYDRFVGQ
ncbi:MAG: hypothetical protein ACP5M0_15680 [Desulfomonilaceae bacterium]